MLRTGTSGSKHSQHVSHCLSGLRLNTVEQFSGAIGAELATNIERLGSGCDHALREGRVALELFRVEVCRLCGNESHPSFRSRSQPPTNGVRFEATMTNAQKPAHKRTVIVTLAEPGSPGVFGRDFDLGVVVGGDVLS